MFIELINDKSCCLINTDDICYIMPPQGHDKYTIVFSHSENAVLVSSKDYNRLVEMLHQNKQILNRLPHCMGV